MRDIDSYLLKFIDSLIFNYENTTKIYHGKEGALRLARELAYGLRDFNIKYQDDIVLNSYNDICCRFYQLNPPIKLNEWVSEICLNLKK